MIDRLLRYALPVMACLMACTPALAQWGMNDVTIIYPLPERPGDASQLISPQYPGLGGPWLPQKLYARLPEINQGEAKGYTYQNLRVVAVRIDPCFRSEGKCLAQVRLVWQPVANSAYGSSAPPGLLEAKDAAIHSFYTLDRAAFEALLKDYEALRSANGVDLSGEPLRVHPVLAKQGLDGPFARGLRTLLAKYVGTRTLWRMTAMKSLVGDDQWAFLGFNVEAGSAKDIVIPRTRGATLQSFQTLQVTQSEFSGGQVSPAPQGSDNLRVILQNSRVLPADDQLLGELGATVARIENPQIHSADTVDCVSCHTAQTAGSLLFERIAQLGNEPQVRRAQFSSPLPLLNLGRRQNNTHVLRALGYVERDLVLSRRVINETAHVAQALNQEAAERQEALARRANLLKPEGGLDFSAL
jgi:hypothetical protein